ncbi:MAG TPA: hypothetical protein VFN23_19610, partial [Ktedonobacteraceae bacterium]|nr:hypothetical protein [Ktedonobacteraceae bacterium]
MNFTFILQPIVGTTLTLSIVWWRCVANLASAFREARVVARLKKDGVIVEAQITDWNIPWNPRKKRLRKVAFSYVVDETSYSANQIIAKKTLRAHIIEDNRIHVCYWPDNPSYVRISPLSIY